MKYLIFTVMLAGLVAPIRADQRVELPKDYRETFVEYLALDRVQNPDQFIRLYADPVAMQGVDASGQLPEGSVLVGEVYSVKKDAEGQVRTSSLNRRIADEMLLIAVMEKRAEFKDSPASPIPVGAWDFAAFKPNGEAAAKNLNECRACHAPLTQSDFVFSIEHLPVQASTTDSSTAQNADRKSTHAGEAK